MGYNFGEVKMSSHFIPFLILLIFSLVTPVSAADNLGQKDATADNNHEMKISPNAMLHSYKPETDNTDNNFGLKPCSPFQNISSKVANTANDRVKISTGKPTDLNPLSRDTQNLNATQSSPASNIISVSQPPNFNDYKTHLGDYKTNLGPCK